MYFNQSPAGVDLPSFAPKEQIRAEFARRVQAAMIRKGWNQSETARQAALHIPDKRFGRDLVSGYVRGRILPSPVHLNALCRALGTTPEEIMPSGGLPSAGEVSSPLKMEDIGEGRVLLQVNQVVDMGTALKILHLLQEKSSAEN